jgi:hypothetical protein
MDGRSIFAALGLRLPPEDAIMAALRLGAQSSAACVAYGLLALCWIVLFARAQRLVGFAAAIAALPELQRAELLKRAQPSFLGKGMSSETFIRHRQRKLLLFAFVALLAAATVVAVKVFQALPL